MTSATYDSTPSMPVKSRANYRPATELSDSMIEWGEKFISFHNANPHVYAALVKCAEEWINATGVRRVGIGLLWERVRWELSLSFNRGGKFREYKLNDGFRAFYSRLIMQREEHLDGMFDLRSSEAALFLEKNAYRCI